MALTAVDDSQPGVGAVEAATVVALEGAGRLDSPLGQTCLVMARRLDSPGVDTGSALAALARRLEELLAAATRGTGGHGRGPQRLVDELAERRRQQAALG